MDGRLDGFTGDVSLYYELAAGLPHQAVLTGSATLLAAATSESVDLAGEDPPAGAGREVDDSLPWLVVVDSGGRLTRLAWLRDQPYWRDVMVLCATATPPGHRALLRRHGVEHIVAGDERVDLGQALTVLADRYGIGAVRVDAGGTLNGVLLRGGLVDEVSVVIAPFVVGDASTAARRLFGSTTSGPVALALRSMEQLRDGYVWLRYEVVHA